MPKSKTKTDLSSVGPSTPPSKPSTSTSSINTDRNDPEPSEPCQPKNTLYQRWLTKSYPDINDEILYLAGCPERIGIEHPRDILISQTKIMRQVAPLVRALVVGLKGWSLEINIKLILIYFRIWKTSWRNPGKSCWEASSFLSETLKSENKESGKSFSALKEVLGSAHEITKTLVEGKTHGHLQVPTAPTKSPKTEKKSTPPPTRRSPNLSLN